MAIDQKLKECLYTSEPFLKSPKHLISGMLHDLRASKELAIRLFLRNLSAQYRHSLLGYVWVFVPPIMTALIWIILQYSNVINLPETTVSYPLYVFSGTIIWRCFLDAVNMPLSSFSSSKFMMAKVSFPHEALFIAAFGNLLFNSFIRIFILILVLLLLGAQFSVTTLLFPVFLLLLIFLGLAVGMVVLPLGLIYADVSRIMGYLFQFLFYVTPVVYVLPDSWCKYNPITPILNLARASVVGSEVVFTSHIFIILVVTTLTFVLSWIVAKITMPHIIERISN